MTDIVLDASACLDYVLRTDRGDAARPRIEDPDSMLHVPSLCDVELTSGLRRALQRTLVEEVRALDALRDYLELPLLVYGHRWLLPRTLELRHNMSTYDAVYLALAERLEAELLTGDTRLARAAEAHTSVMVASL